MLFLLFHAFETHGHHIPIFNLFRYLTFRTGAALFTGQAVVGLMGNRFIDWMRKKQGRGQPIRSDGIERHVLEKAGTPTMGGFMILAGVIVGTLIWGDLANPFVWIVLMVTSAYGVLGFLDDYAKVTKQTTAGVSGWMKIVHPVRRGGRWPPTSSWCRASGPVDPGLGSSVAFPIFKSALDQPRLVLHRLRHDRDRRLLQRREPDRRPGRSRHRPGDDRGGGVRLHRLPGWQREVRRLPAGAFHPRRRRDRALLWSPDRRGSRAFCGSTRRRPRSSWAIRDRWRWAARSAPSRWPPNTRSCWSSSAVCSCWRPSR